jgi:hypothetical protein
VIGRQLGSYRGVTVRVVLPRFQICGMRAYEALVFLAAAFFSRRLGALFAHPAFVWEGRRGSTLLIGVKDVVLRLHGGVAGVAAVCGAGIGGELV